MDRRQVRAVRRRVGQLRLGRGAGLRGRAVENRRRGVRRGRRQSGTRPGDRVRGRRRERGDQSDAGRGREQRPSRRGSPEESVRRAQSHAQRQRNPITTAAAAAATVRQRACARQ